MAVPYYGDFAEDDTVLIPFNTFDSNDPQASVTITNLADADIMVHKDGGLTQIATDGATVVINFDSITGNHMITIDTSVDAAYATGSEYSVRIEGTTVDAGTINAWVGSFSIERAGGVLALMKATTLASIKAETALIVADTNELQSDDVPGLIATAQSDLDIITGVSGVNLLTATQASIDAIEADTNELQGDDVPTLISNLDAVVDTVKAETVLILADTAEIGTAGAGLTDITINAASVDLIWDEVLTGATHNVASSAGRRLRDASGQVIESGTAQAGSTTNTINLATGASATDGAYDPSLLAIVGGTGAGQSRNVLEYDGTAKVAVLDRNWKVTPDNTSEYVIYSDAGREHVNEGLAQAGASSTITLNALASSSDDAYVGQTVFIRSGTGDDQAGLCSSYNGTTKVLTIIGTWSTTPDATSAYVMLPTSLHDDVSLAAILADTNELQTDDIPALLATLQTSVNGIGTAGGASLAVDASDDNFDGGIAGVTVGTTKVGTQTGTYLDTSTSGGTDHVLTHATNILDWVYLYEAGGGTSPVSFVFTGSGTNNDVFNFYVWDHVGGSWDIIWNYTGEGAAASSFNPSLFARHMGTSSAELGKVYIRVESSSTAAVLTVDTLIIEYAVTSRSVGYDGGQVWVDTIDGQSGTEIFVNGTADNPVDLWASALTIASDVGLHQYYLSRDSSVTLTATLNNSQVSGGAVALGGQDITGSRFISCAISGTATGTDEFDFDDCDLLTVTIDNDAHHHECGLAGTYTIAQAGQFIFNGCYGLTDAPWILDFAAVGATVVHLFGFNGDVTATNMAVGDTLHVTGHGVVTTATCTGGTIEHNGDFRYTDTGGNVTEVISDTHTEIEAIVADTNELQTDWANGGRLDLLLDRLITEFDTATGEPGQGAPGVSIKRGEKIDWLYKFLRNRSTSSATTISVYADDGTTVDHKSTHSDSGTVYDRTEFITGP